MRPWPPGVEVHDACACVVVDPDGGAWLAYAPDHRCENPDRLRLVAARALIDLQDSGPDEGWVHAYGDGTGWMTWISTPGAAAS